MASGTSGQIVTFTPRHVHSSHLKASPAPNPLPGCSPSLPSPAAAASPPMLMNLSPLSSMRRITMQSSEPPALLPPPPRPLPATSADSAAAAPPGPPATSTDRSNSQVAPVDTWMGMGQWVGGWVRANVH